jgi:hypothetical protein
MLAALTPEDLALLDGLLSKLVGELVNCAVDNLE